MANTFAGSSNGGGLVLARTLSVEKQASVDLGVLQSASRIVNEKFSQDAQAVPDLGESLSAREYHYTRTCSVLLKYDFQMAQVSLLHTLYFKTICGVLFRSGDWWQYPRICTSIIKVRVLLVSACIYC